jgi:hypothetical protein
MIDAMRAARIIPEFQAAVRVHMVESSPRLTTFTRLSQKTLE